MSPDRSGALDRLRGAVDLLLRGSLCDAREELQRIELPEGDSLSELRASMSLLVDYLGRELSSKESAFASVQTSMWELDAAQEQLRATEAHYRTTLGSVGDGLISTDARGRVDFMNPVAERLTGWSADEARGQLITTVFRIVDARTHAPVESPTVRALEEGVTVGLANHTVLVARDGTERQIADSCAPIRDGGDQILGAVLVFRDVTEEYRRRERLRSSEERHRNLVESSSDWIWEVNAQGVYTYASLQVQAILGMAPEEVVGRAPFDLMSSSEAARVREVWGPLLAVGAPIVRLENTNLHRDGHEVVLETSGVPFFSPDGALLGYRGVDRDITERRRSEDALRESERMYRALFEGGGEGIVVADVATRVFLYSNPTWCDMFGYAPEEVSGLGVAAIHPADSWPRVLAEFDAQARRDKVLAPDMPCRRKDGSVFVADIRVRTADIGGRRCNVGFFCDATERMAYEAKLDSERAKRQQAELELRHAQKLQAVGELAAGIAHEVNTPTQYVGDSVHFLAQSFEDLQGLMSTYRRALATLTAEPGHEALAQTIREAEESADLAYLEKNAPAAFQRALDGISRIATIVSAMKEFAHPDQREKTPADLNRALQSTLTIARNEYKYIADVETELEPLPPVMCHLGDLNQVFLNLLVNAAHAIADVVGTNGDRGRIRVRTALEGTKVRIEIADTGGGIPEEIRTRVFDPFFTTKEVGRGSGQGLAIARSVVVDKHGGSITFESARGKGTTFTIRLPVDGDADPGTAHAAP